MFLGVPRKLNLNMADLEQRFRGLSRQFHPDYFYNATLAERRASLERSSYLNDAYRTLRQPIARIEYLLGLEGFSAGAQGRCRGKVPAALLEEVFELNEELDEVRDLRRAGAPGRLEGAGSSAPGTDRREGSGHEDDLTDSSRSTGTQSATRGGRMRGAGRCSPRCVTGCSNGTTSTICSRE